MSNIYEKLIDIQQKLKAPKNQEAKDFKTGKVIYRYRSCEDILEAVKPLLNENKVSLTVKDDIVEIGSRIYVKAIATLYDTESEGIVENTAFAREAEEKRGMDASQITGTASSYARKYCLNGLFLIDDVKDADTDEVRFKEVENEKISFRDIEALRDRFEALNIDEEGIIKQYGLKDLRDMTVGQMVDLNGRMNNIEKESKNDKS